MVLAAFAVAVSTLVALWRGGRPANMATTGLDRIGLLFGGSLLELVGSLWGSGSTALALLIAGYVLLMGFAVINIRLTGMILIAMGLAANFVVFTADGGMPVREGSRQAAISLAVITPSGPETG